MGAGRPTFEITDEVLEQIKKMGSLFLNKKEIAACLGITYETYNQKAKDEPRMEEYRISGASQRIRVIKGRFVEKAETSDNHCMTMALKNYSDMTDKSQVETTGRDGGPIEKKYTIEFVHGNTTDKDATPPEAGEIADDQG